MTTKGLHFTNENSQIINENGGKSQDLKKMIPSNFNLLYKRNNTSKKILYIFFIIKINAGRDQLQLLWDIRKMLQW